MGLSTLRITITSLCERDAKSRDKYNNIRSGDVPEQQETKMAKLDYNKMTMQEIRDTARRIIRDSVSKEEADRRMM